MRQQSSLESAKRPVTHLLERAGDGKLPLVGVRFDAVNIGGGSDKIKEAGSTSCLRSKIHPADNTMVVYVRVTPCFCVGALHL